MDDLQKQVKLARRRLFWQRYLSAAPWCLSAFLLVAVLAIAATKVWTLPVQSQVWPWAWLGKRLALGLITAWIVAYLRRPDSIQAAIELDHRFGLKERVSSCLSLTPEEQSTEVGQALVRDALRRVSKVNVAERFRVTANRSLALPFVMATLAFGLTLLSDAQPDPVASAQQAATITVQKRVQASTEALRKKMEERKKQAVEEGLPEASELFDKLEKGVDSLKQKEDVDRQKALVKLNDLARDLQARQKELMGRDDIQKQLNALKDIKQGPAEKMAQAMKNGDFKAAVNEIKELQDKLAKGEMSKEDQQKLQEQLGEMKDKLQALAQAQEEAKRDLKEQIQQKLAQGDRDAAGKLQNKLDELARKDGQADQMKKLAEKLAAAAEAMKQGDAKDAAGQMGELAQDMEAMQQELSEMEMLDDALQQIASAKESMNCENCDGQGCEKCQADMADMASMDGMGGGQGENGRGMGEGRGEGDRPESETNTNFYDSQVQAKPGKGKAIVTGAAPGPNKAGQVLEEVKIEIDAGKHSTDDPLTGQRLPKPQRELTREYFDAFREGK